jgi:hypothetical protein
MKSLNLIKIHSQHSPNSPLSVTCPANQVIQVKTALYGQSSIGCSSSPFTSILSTLANGQNSYSVKIMGPVYTKTSAPCYANQICSVITDPIFPTMADPCYGTVKYAQVTYNCITPQHYVTANDFGSMSLSCPAGQMIQIVSAFYGQTSNNQGCYSSQFPTYVVQKANGMNSISYKIGVAALGYDPCSGIYYYLNLHLFIF